MPIKNTPKARKPIVDAIIKRRFNAGLKGKALANEIIIADNYVQWTFLAQNQMAAGKKVKL